MCHLH
ncbi:hypothetical protein L345_09906 [Ophiophagus hannah]